jgi:hypothetical protein
MSAADFKRQRDAIKYGKFASDNETLKLIDLIEEIQDWRKDLAECEDDQSGQKILSSLVKAKEKRRLSWAQIFEKGIASNDSTFFHAIGDILAAQKLGKRSYYYSDDTQKMARRAMDAYDDFIGDELLRVAAKLKKKLGRKATNDEIYGEMRKPQKQNITKSALWNYLVAERIFFVRSFDKRDDNKQEHRARLWKTLGLQDFPQAKSGTRGKK